MPTARHDPISTAIARISSGSGQIVGVGVLVARDRVLTTAAAARSALDDSAGSGTIWVDLPFVRPGHRTSATVHRATERTTILHLTEPAAGPAGPAPLFRPATLGGRRVRVVGFPPGRRDGVWLGGELVGRLVVTEGQAPALTADYDGSPVWDDDVGAVVAMTSVAAPDSPDGLIPIDEAFALDPFTLPGPYPGIQPFGEPDASLFHGRDDDVDRVESALLDSALVAVAGRSGAGKSSLIHAGLIPRLHARGVAVAAFRVTPSDPLTALDGVVGELPDHQDAVIVADQFEDLALADPGTARRLLHTLVDLTRSEGGRPADGRPRRRVVVTTRWDAMDELTGAGADYVLVSIGPMGRDQLRAAIVGPAERPPGLAFDVSVIERIVDDAVDEPGQLPLVASLLAELWENRTGGTIRDADYERLGGVHRALTRLAERAVDALDDPDNIRGLLTRLTRPVEGGTDVRRPAPVDEFTHDQRQAAEHLVRSRVLVAGPDPAGRQTVELAHQALIDLWPRLRAWLDDDRDFRTWHERVERQRADWGASGADPGRLLRGTTLLRAEDWLVEREADVSGPNRDFIWAGRARARRERWLRRVVRAVVAAAAIGAITLAGLFALQRGEARQQEAAAESRVLAAGSADLAQTEPARSLELALAAYRTQANPETEQVLFSRYLDRRETIPDDGEWRMTPDGSHIVRVVDDGSRLETAPVDDLSRTTASVARRGSQFQNPGTMCLCMDGTLLADRLTDGTIEVRTLPDLALVGTVGGPEVLHSETSAEIGLRNGLLVVTNGPRAQWWDPVAGTLVDEVDLVVLGAVDPGDDAWIVDHPDPALTAAFSPQSGALTVIDRSTGEPVERIEVSADALVLRIYAEGDHVGVFRRGSVPELWRTGDGVRTLGPLPSVAPRCAAGQEGVHRCSPPRYGFVWNFLDEPGLALFGDRGRLTWHDPDTGDTLRVLDLGSRQPISASADGATVLHWEPVGGFGVARLSPDHWLACADPAEDAGDTAAERTC